MLVAWVVFKPQESVDTYVVGPVLIFLFVPFVPFVLFVPHLRERTANVMLIVFGQGLPDPLSHVPDIDIVTISDDPVEGQNGFLEPAHWLTVVAYE